MLGRLFDELAGRRAVAQPQPDEALALAALMLHIAGSDRQVDADEMVEIRAILTGRYELHGQALDKVLDHATALELKSTDTVRFTRAIKQAVPLDARISVIEALWSVVLADGRRDPHEDRLMRLSADLLGISDRDSNLARLRV